MTMMRTQWMATMSIPVPRKVRRVTEDPATEPWLPAEPDEREAHQGHAFDREFEQS